MKGEAVSVFLRAVYSLGLKPPQLFRTLNDYEILQKKEVTYSVDRQGEKFGAAFKLARQVMNALRNRIQSEIRREAKEEAARKVLQSFRDIVEMDIVDRPEEPLSVDITDMDIVDRLEEPLSPDDKQKRKAPEPE